MLTGSYCLVPMTVLRSTYGLTRGTIVRVKVRAKNAYGYSGYSPVNSVGATVQTEPGVVTGLVIGSGTT